MQQSIGTMAGVSFLALGLFYLFRAQDLVVWLEALQKEGHSASLTTGAISIMIGFFIVGFHWIWEGWPMILTIIGVLVIIKGFIRPLFPGCLPANLALLILAFKFYTTLFRLRANLAGIEHVISGSSGRLT